MRKNRTVTFHFGYIYTNFKRTISEEKLQYQFNISNNCTSTSNSLVQNFNFMRRK